MDFIDKLTDRWVDWMVASSWQLALLVTFIALLTSLLRKASPRLRYALWILVLVKAFLPPSFAAPTGIGNWGIRHLAESKAVPTPVSQLIAGHIESTILTRAGISSTDGAEANGFRPASLLFLVWAVGGILFWVVVGFHYRSVTQLIRSTPAIDEGPLCVAMEKSAIGLQLEQTPELRTTETLTSPFLFGLFRPCIVLPQDLINAATSNDVSIVLTHELVHLKRRDTWIGWWQVLVQGLFWFHPFVWWANRSLRQQREEACDDLVLREGKIDPDQYGQCMMQVLTSAKAHSIADLRFLGVFERGTHLQTRLEKIMNFEASSASYGIASKLAIGLFAITLLPMAFDSSTLQVQADGTMDKRAPTTYPQIVETQPKLGQTDVKASLNEIRVTFDRDMSGGMSWTGEIPVDKSGKPRWLNRRTCVLPVKLEAAKYYRIGINSTSFQNFQSGNGVATPPTVIYFATEGAPPEFLAKAKTPEIVKLVPANGSMTVDPATQQLVVSFNMPMSEGMSWTGGGDRFPDIPKGKKPRWSKDKKSCSLPVQLKPNQTYRLGINSLSHKNFQSESGVPVKPILYEFKTR